MNMPSSNESHGRSLTHERLGRALAGAAVLVSLVLAWLHHPLWLVGAGMTGGNLILSALTDRCAVRSLLIRMGFPGERDLGRSEAWRERTERGVPSRVALPDRLARRRSWKSPATLN